MVLNTIWSVKSKAFPYTKDNKNLVITLICIGNNLYNAHEVCTWCVEESNLCSDVYVASNIEMVYMYTGRAPMQNAVSNWQRLALTKKEKKWKILTLPSTEKQPIRSTQRKPSSSA